MTFCVNFGHPEWLNTLLFGCLDYVKANGLYPFHCTNTMQLYVSLCAIIGSLVKIL